ncbi:MAG: small multi-drug export protein [Sphaerochaetaceae bacterium]|jgi:uncharacterized membrane protein|nr:small multi-drug export protein [Sphaerochaetaceae bacterium]MDX9808645.1 small multi-drug export protein [Sphaerochaetaceae bacterium]NLV83981.1 small multi-drug export protein [Spirochaetales bacterium]
MDLMTVLGTIALGILPISELRGAIPFAYLRGTPLWLAALIGTAANLLVSPLVYIFLSTIHHWLYGHWKWYATIFDSKVEHVRRRLSAKIHTYGFLGIVLFVGIPLPVTGAWTGTLGAWVLGLDRKRSIVAVSGGVLMACCIVTLVLALGKGAASLFIKIM